MDRGKEREKEREDGSGWWGGVSTSGGSSFKKGYSVDEREETGGGGGGGSDGDIEPEGRRESGKGRGRGREDVKEKGKESVGEDEGENDNDNEGRERKDSTYSASMGERTQNLLNLLSEICFLIQVCIGVSSLDSRKKLSALFLAVPGDPGKFLALAFLHSFRLPCVSMGGSMNSEITAKVRNNNLSYNISVHEMNSGNANYNNNNNNYNNNNNSYNNINNNSNNSFLTSHSNHNSGSHSHSQNESDTRSTISISRYDSTDSYHSQNTHHTISNNHNNNNTANTINNNDNNNNTNNNYTINTNANSNIYKNKSISGNSIKNTDNDINEDTHNDTDYNNSNSYSVTDGLTASGSWWWRPHTNSSIGSSTTPHNTTANNTHTTSSGTAAYISEIIGFRGQEENPGVNSPDTGTGMGPVLGVGLGPEPGVKVGGEESHAPSLSGEKIIVEEKTEEKFIEFMENITDESGENKAENSRDSGKIENGESGSILLADQSEVEKELLKEGENEVESGGSPIRVSKPQMQRSVEKDREERDKDRERERERDRERERERGKDMSIPTDNSSFLNWYCAVEQRYDKIDDIRIIAIFDYIFLLFKPSYYVYFILFYSINFFSTRC
jgi:hypothetical protein